MPLPDAATMGSNGLRAWSAQRLCASSSDITSSTVHRRCELYNGNLRNLLSTLSLSNRNVLRFAPYWLCMLVGLGCWVYAAYMLLAYPAEQSDSLGPIGSNWIDPLVFIWLGAATMVAGYALWVVSSNEESRSSSLLHAPERSTTLFVAAQGDEIVVTTSYGFWSTYTKRPYSPGLKLARSSDATDDEMLARALQAATDKARELGWFS